MSHHQKAPSFRVRSNPGIRSTPPKQAGEWDWLYGLTVQEWDELVQANVDDQGEESKSTTFFVVRPGTNDVLECPIETAMKIYEEVLAGRVTPSPAPMGFGNVPGITKVKVSSSGGRMHVACRESFY